MDPSLLTSCRLCPRRCGANRLKGQRGFCGAGDTTIVAHYGPHFGEEPPISGTGGAGNIFFSPCNLRCSYCQNYQISHMTLGREAGEHQLVEIFFELRARGVHNINLVSPTPYVPLLAPAIAAAKTMGIGIPFVYNTNAYENPETIRLLEGLVDIYLPDFKYWSSGAAERLSLAPGYPLVAQASVLEMQAQVGRLEMERGIARKGLIIRHLVLPGRVAGTKSIVRWIREHLGSATFLSLMSQYYPLYRAGEHPLINRRIRPDEYDMLIAFLNEEGFENVFVQEPESAEALVPDFEQAEPFGKAEDEKLEKMRR